MHGAEQREPLKAWRAPSLTVLTNASEAELLFRNGRDGFQQQGRRNGGS